MWQLITESKLTNIDSVRAKLDNIIVQSQRVMDNTGLTAH